MDCSYIIYILIFILSFILNMMYCSPKSPSGECSIKSYLILSIRIYLFIIQQIVTLSKYGHDALDIRNRYPAVYIASYVGRKSEVRKCRQRDLQGFRLFCYQFVE